LDSIGVWRRGPTKSISELVLGLRCTSLLCTPCTGEVKEWTSSPVDRRLAAQRSASFSSEEVFGTAADAVQAAALEQLRPFADTGLSLVVVLANPHQRFVPLGADDMAKSLFGTTDVIQVPATGLAITRRVSMGTGALAMVDGSGNVTNPHPYLSAVVVIHARENARGLH
jgi:hypothetical protein